MIDGLFTSTMRMIFGAPRASGWSALRNRTLKGADCLACGTDRDLEAHHLVPVHVAPELELEPTNLVPLCRDCHFIFGHLKSWTSYNEHVIQDAGNYRRRLECRP